MNATTRRRSRDTRSGKNITVRMYNVGFGDAFVVRIPTADRERKILFDCGSIKSVHDMSDVVARIIKDVTDADGIPRIDVVVATHRHKDHVSGFQNPAWKQVEVTEVWLPWTEDPKDPHAKKIRGTHAKLAAALERALALRMAASGAAANRWQGYHEIAANALSNEDAMRTLHEGFAGTPKRRFLSSKDAAGSLVTDALPGIVVHVLGPSRDPEVIRDMDPPSGQSYLRMSEFPDSGAEAPDAFNANWWVEPEDYTNPDILSQDDRKVMQQMGSDFEMAVATSLDKAVNGTSLMLMIEVGEQWLLFPGDAQWGTWNAALENPDAVALLKRTTFYKIGHHGSHNATPVKFVEKVVGKDFWAMVSTNSVAKWQNIPRAPLLKAIGQRTQKLVRSDKPDSANGVFILDDDWSVDAQIPLQ